MDEHELLDALVRGEQVVHVTVRVQVGPCAVLHENLRGWCDGRARECCVRTVAVARLEVERGLSREVKVEQPVVVTIPCDCELARHRLGAVVADCGEGGSGRRTIAEEHHTREARHLQQVGLPVIVQVAD